MSSNEAGQINFYPIAHLGEGSSKSAIFAVSAWLLATVAIYILGQRYFLNREKELIEEMVQEMVESHERMFLPPYYTCVERTPSYQSLSPSYFNNSDHLGITIQRPDQIYSKV